VGGSGRPDANPDRDLSGDDYTTPGTNSVGDDDWLLVFQGT
jgi:hypothetical protein